MEPQFEEETQSNIQVEEQTSLKQESKLNTFSNLEEMRKSETEVKTFTNNDTKIDTKTSPLAKDKVFARKEDKKKALYKRRAKILTTVYASVCAMLLAFVGINIATMVKMSTQMQTNTETITRKETELAELKEIVVENEATNGGFYISLNEPRDYSDDVKQLTFWDKVTIVFKNIFG